MNTLKNKKGHMSIETLTKMQQINDNYSKTRAFSKYLQELGELFGVSIVQVTEEHKKFLGGFIEGEASLNVSAKKIQTAKFGMLLDPEFSITQHVNGFSTLYLALLVFRTGRIRYKSGSKATLVYQIDNRKSLEEKVVPFFEKHVKPYGSAVKVERLENFRQLLALLSIKGHANFQTFRDEMLPIWDALRVQRGQSNETFESLEAAQQYVTNIAQGKNPLEINL